jgi:hypothetical protein
MGIGRLGSCRYGSFEPFLLPPPHRVQSLFLVTREIALLVRG